MTDLMTPPPHAVITPSGPVWLSEDGIIVTITTAHTQTLADAKENIQYNKRVAAGIPRPLLVDMSRVRSMSKDAREEYVKKDDEPLVTAVALVTNSSISRMVGNFFIGLTQSYIPVKLFTEPEKAREWLLQYIVSNDTGQVLIKEDDNGLTTDR